MKRVQLQPAYVLHRRSYRENSFLVDLFTPDYGRVTVIAKGVRQQRSSSQGLLQPFSPLLVSWAGRSELVSLSHVEASGEVRHLQGDNLFAGFYLNELLTMLLEKWDVHQRLYAVYSDTVMALQTSPLNQMTLRLFEKRLLEELGYGLLSSEDVALKETIFPDKYYRFSLEQGFLVSELGEVSQAKAAIFSGKSLLDFSNEEWRDEASLQDAKRLIRHVLSSLLGEKTIHSRKLFMQVEEQLQ